MKRLMMNKTQIGGEVNKMKRIIAVAVVMMVLAFGSMAQAYPIANGWSLNLSQVNPAYSNATNIDYLLVQGNANLTLAGPPAAGVAFTEDAFLQINQYRQEGTPFSSNFAIGGNFLYIEALGLAGVITSFGATQYDYVFTPGVGTIKVYLGPANRVGEILLASLSVLPGSGGQGVVVDGGVGPSGTSGIDSNFLWAMAGLFTTGSGWDIGNGGGIAFVDTINTLKQNGQSYVISSQGEVNTAVPEPSTLVLLGAGLVGLGLAARRKMK